MLYVVVEELIPEMSQGEHSNIGTVFFAVGFSLMMVLDVALGLMISKILETIKEMYGKIKGDQAMKFYESGDNSSSIRTESIKHLHK